jgi:hypothetical protein
MPWVRRVCKVGSERAEKAVWWPQSPKPVLPQLSFVGVPTSFPDAYYPRVAIPELNTMAFRMYQQFRPKVSSGQQPEKQEQAQR